MRRFVALVIITLALSAIVTYIIVENKKKEKTGWINLSRIFNDFALKKELEQKLLVTKQARKKITDSLEFDLKVLAKQLNSDIEKNRDKISLFEIKKENYLNKKNEFEEDNSIMEKQYNEQIITQINQYMKDFGKKYRYTYIFGTDGSGSLMFADERNDITEEAGKYINERYKGNTE